MSLAKNFNKSLYKQLSIYAAWFPVANTFKLGDYGLIEGGVFRQMGNILKLGINFEQAAGQSASLDFMSAGATVVRTVGNASVDSLPEVGDLEAKLTYSFEKQDSCLIKASLTALQMENIHQVGKELAAHQDWEHRFRVVSAIYQGEHCVIILTQDANTKVEFAGKVNLLKQVELGNVQIKPTVSSSSERSQVHRRYRGCRS